MIISPSNCVQSWEAALRNLRKMNYYLFHRTNPSHITHTLPALNRDDGSITNTSHMYGMTTHCIHQINTHDDYFKQQNVGTQWVSLCFTSVVTDTVWYLRNKTKHNLVNHSVPTVQFKTMEIVSSFSQAHCCLLDYTGCIMNWSNQHYGIQAMA